MGLFNRNRKEFLISYNFSIAKHCNPIIGITEQSMGDDAGKAESLANSIADALKASDKFSNVEVKVR